MEKTRCSSLAEVGERCSAASQDLESNSVYVIIQISACTDTRIVRFPYLSSLLVSNILGRLRRRQTDSFRRISSGSRVCSLLQSGKATASKHARGTLITPVIQPMGQHTILARSHPIGSAD